MFIYIYIYIALSRSLSLSFSLSLSLSLSLFARAHTRGSEKHALLRCSERVVSLDIERNGGELRASRLPEVNIICHRRDLHRRRIGKSL